eukprot:TRINITY_DN816_c0_g1_i2.p1 TRINITY_DN816_c0_g1~~TRINITY_DN816_c0_g1_i2.p1  ORF type:complete len:103 (-),score=23.17 TRINITY_DN816_c0_g1_i2:129-437(-)
MSHTSAIAASALKKSATNVWIQTSNIPMQSCFVMGIAAVLFAAAHQFYNNNTIVVNKSNKRQWEEKESPKFVSDKFIQDHSPHRPYFNPDSLRVRNPWEKKN